MNDKPLVWIIDDDDISKYLMKRNLKELSITKIVDFPDSLQALKLLESNINSPEELPDIIFLDLHMPILNGFQFMEEFENSTKNTSKNIQVAMLTSSINAEDLKRAESYPAITDYFIKPFKLRDLKKVIDRKLQE